MKRNAALLLTCLVSSGAPAADLKSGIDTALAAVEAKVIDWRRHIHQYPELSNREFKTAALVAEHLENLGLEVKTAIAHTGVVGVLRGGKPGPVVALRADMDALPVTEQTGLPFASKVRTTYKDNEVGVMHACGHDAHTAILMGVAELLSGMREELPGTVKFIFQPAEEGAPEGEEGGASLMIAEGVLDGPDKPDAIFGLHVLPMLTGHLYYRTAGTMAASDRLAINVTGKQTHGASPWLGTDPVTVSAQLILALQTIPSRQVKLTTAPAVISIGSIHAGNRGNIIPETVEMEGTLRTFDTAMREDIIMRMQRTVDSIAGSVGATAELTIDPYAPVTYNDPDLTQRMAATLHWAAGEGKVKSIDPLTGAEDFSYFQQQIPGMYFFLGINKEGVGEWQAAPNHSPLFYVNDDTLKVGVRALAGLAVDYLSTQ